jgi:hypothetical protein
MYENTMCADKMVDNNKKWLIITKKNLSRRLIADFFGILTFV